MTYKTILTVLATPKDAEPLIGAALKTPQGRNVHILGTHGEPSQFVILSAPIDVPDVATLSQLYEEADQRMGAVAAAFKTAADKEGISYEWRPVRTPEGNSGTSALASSRSADLVIVRQPASDEMDSASVNCETLLFEGGSPVLLIGPAGQMADPVKRIVIAWDGSREAARAVKDAMPFLKAAETVEIVIVDPDKLADIDRPTPGADLAAALDRQGIKVSVETVSRGDRSTAEAIAARLKAANADMLVMGAYAHPRIRDWLFGGVTRSFLADPAVPTLLSR